MLLIKTNRIIVFTNMLSFLVLVTGESPKKKQCQSGGIDVSQYISPDCAYACRVALDETDYESFFVFDCCFFSVV